MLARPPGTADGPWQPRPEARPAGCRRAVRCATRAAHAGHRPTGTAGTGSGAAPGGEPGRAVHGQESKNTASPGCRANRRMSNAPGWAAMSGNSARLPSGHQCPSLCRNVRGHEPMAGAAGRAGHQLPGHLPAGYRIHRNPGTDAAAVHVPIGLVLMPGRALRGPALLHQDGDRGGSLHPRGTHQRGGHSRNPRVAELLQSRALPSTPAEVLHENARVTGAAGDLGERQPGLASTAFDPGALSAAAISPRRIQSPGVMHMELVPAQRSATGFLRHQQYALLPHSSPGTFPRRPA